MASLDLHASLQLLKDALPTSSLLIELPTHKRTYSKRVREWEPGAFAYLLGRHTSSYRPTGRSWGRGHNIEAAANALDGLVIEGHGKLSFNEVVGPTKFSAWVYGCTRDRPRSRGRRYWRRCLPGGDRFTRCSFAVCIWYPRSLRPLEAPPLCAKWNRRCRGVGAQGFRYREPIRRSGSNTCEREGRSVNGRALVCKTSSKSRYFPQRQIWSDVEASRTNDCHSHTGGSLARRPTNGYYSPAIPG